MAKAKVEKNEALEQVRASIEKKHGKGILRPLSSDSILEVPVFSSGIISVDKALGCGGIPRGRIIEIFGGEGSGKSTFCWSCVSQAQKEGLCAYFDTENKADLKWAKLNGVDLNKLEFSQVGLCETVLDSLQIMVESGLFRLIVIDSVAAMPTKAELEGDAGDATIGVQAKMLSVALKKLAELVAKTQTTIIFVNQVRDKISLGFSGGFGDKETTCGGRAIRFYASIRMKVTKIKQLTVGKGAETQSIGSVSQAKIIKNQVGIPFLKADFTIYNTEGISELAQILDYAINLKVIKKEGAWCSFEGNKLGQGKRKIRDFLKKPENKSIYEKIKSITLEKIRKQEVAESESEDSEEPEAKEE